MGDRRAMRSAADMPTSVTRTRPRSIYECILASGSRFLTRDVGKGRTRSEVAKIIGTTSVATRGV